MSPVCAVGRFERASDAFEWLAGSIAEGLLDLLGDTVGAVTVASVPHPSGPTRPALLNRQRLQAPADDASSAATKRSVGDGKRSVKDIDGVRAEIGLTPCTSRLAAWSARAAAQSDVPDLA